jgi:molybdopterin-guanine dinucleotide biosynthesis protein
VSKVVYGFDPGVTTGWAKFDQDGDDATLTAWGDFKFQELESALDSLDLPDLVVVEAFKTRAATAHLGTKAEVKQTIECEGIIKSWARRHKAEVIEQTNQIKKIAEKMTNVSPPSKHSQSHKVDAYNHAMYHMIRNEMAKSELAKRGGKP